MLEVVFILCLIVLAYIYAGYPVCIFVLSNIFPKTIKKDDYSPVVSILISAYNEEEWIEGTLINKLKQDYPEDKIEIIVVSDGSTDDTDQRIRNINDNRVKFYRQEPRQGKTAALNMAVKKASGDIVVFSDANSIYESNSIKNLVRNFSDPSVGYVTGKMVYTNPDGSLIGDGCSSYMRYENFIRKQESGFNSLVGVDGGIDAVRKELYHDMKPDQLPDFVLPLQVVEKGKRVIYEPEAVLREQALNDNDQEYKMRVRVTLRALWALFDMRVLFNPFRFPLFSWQLISHKLLRYFAWLPLSLLLILNPFLLDNGVIYQLIFALQVLAYTLALIGYIRRKKPDSPFYIAICYYFILINVAAAEAFSNFLHGKKQVIWSPRTG